MERLPDLSLSRSSRSILTSEDLRSRPSWSRKSLQERRKKAVPKRPEITVSATKGHLIMLCHSDPAVAGEAVMQPAERARPGFQSLNISVSEASVMSH